MINFELSDEQKIVKSTISDFSAKVLRPETRRFDTVSTIDDGVLEALWSMGIVQSLAATGDEDGHSQVTNSIVLEELAVGDATPAATLGATLGFVQAIVTHGSNQQRTKLLPDFAGSGSFRSAAIALLEPGFDFDITRLSTSAVRDGERFVLNGIKSMVALAARCSHFLVIASLEGAVDAFIVPASLPGISVSRPAATLGLRALQCSNVTFDHVTVPANLRLGEGNGADVQQLIDSARVGLSAIMAGLSRGVLEYVVPYTKERVVFGTPLAQKQTIAFNIANMHIDVEAMRWLNWQAAWALEGKASATKAAQLAYSYASRQTMAIADNGVQALGGHGYVREHPMELWYRNARSLSVLEGIVGV